MQAVPPVGNSNSYYKHFDFINKKISEVKTNHPKQAEKNKIVHGEYMSSPSNIHIKNILDISALYAVVERKEEKLSSQEKAARVLFILAQNHKQKHFVMPIYFPKIEAILNNRQVKQYRIKMLDPFFSE